MRVQSERKVHIRGVLIGGAAVKICLPLVAEDKASLLSQADESMAQSPDLLEWRVDASRDAQDPAGCLEVLAALRDRIGTLPLIFTCRIHSEGGLRKLPQADRLNLILGAIQSGHVDLVDVEMGNEPAFLETVKEAARAGGVKLILSYHNFEGTPKEEIIYNKLVTAQDLGADIAKVAVMPDGYGDVLTLFNANYRARTREVHIPIITMAMDAQGGISRIAGGLFGSDLTFAMGVEASAPGQLPIDRLREVMKVVYDESTQV